MGKTFHYLMEKFKAESIVYGIPSKLYWHSGVDTIWDRTRVPEGKHLIQLEHYTARVNDFPEEKWAEIKREFPKELIKQWQLYAPNMTEENVIGAFIETPVEIKAKLDRNIDYVRDVPGRQGKFRPIPELAYYRTPIEGLYLCSADTHVGVGVRGSCGYTSYKIIAEDFGLKKHWEEKGRSY